MTATRQRAWLAGIAALAIAVRLLHVWQSSGDVLFDSPVIDARLNVQEAKELNARGWAGPAKPFWKPPLYSYVLAAQLAVFGDGYTAPRVLQALLDAVSCLLVFGIGALLFSRRVALAAAIATALCGPMIFFSGQLVSASLAVCLDLAAIYALLRARRDGASWPRCVGVGALFGLAALVRAEVLLVAAGAAAWVALAGDGDRRRRWIAAAALAGGVVLLVAPVTLRNAVRGGDAVLISANGGINFYIGTDPAYYGMVGLRPGTEWERLIREPEGEGIVGVGSAHSRYFTRKALRMIGRDPIRFAGHAVTKAALFWHGYEIMSNLDLYEGRDDSLALAALMWDAPGFYFPFGLLAPLGLLGMAMVVRRRHPARVLVGFVGVLVGVAMLFFVTSRFRLPAVPIIALFAAFAVEQLVQRWRDGDRRGFGVRVGAVLVIAVGVNSGMFREGREAYAREVAAEAHHYRGTALFDDYGRYEEAVVELRKAIELEPTRASTHFNLGQTLERLGRYGEMVDAMREVVRVTETTTGEDYFVPAAINGIVHAVQQDPQLAATPFGSGVKCMATGDLDCAVAGFAEARDDAFTGLALLTRAERYLVAGVDQAAVVDLRDAALLRPSHADTRLLLGLASHRVGDRDGARAAFDAFRSLEWPRGNYFRKLTDGVRPAGALDAGIIAAYLEYYPGEGTAQEALAAIAP
jgi:4-amino-4-deoxy-L-arabinose transferase-like glycosyltransferase/Flp pilus assembly protein TadD